MVTPRCNLPWDACAIWRGDRLGGAKADALVREALPPSGSQAPRSPVLARGRIPREQWDNRRSSAAY